MKVGYMSKRKEKDIYEGYEPDWKDIQVLQELTEQWVKDHPNSTDLDAAEYYAHLCVDYLRGK